MMRRIESFIRTVVWKRLRKSAWQPLCTRTETLFDIGIRRMKALSVNIELVRNRTLTARAIGIYAVRKLIAQNRIGPIFKPIIRYIGYMFSGLKFSCKGRFTRRQRASLTVFGRGSVKLSTFTSDIDYSYAHVPLKFGVGCIKIWINRGFRNKGKIANTLEYIPYYKPRKSKLIGLTDEQNLRFTFDLTPKLKATANQLKTDILITDEEQEEGVINQANESIPMNELFTKQANLKKRQLYKYLRWRDTNSYAAATDDIHNTLRNLDHLTGHMKQHYVASYVRAQITEEEEDSKIIKLHTIRTMAKIINRARSLRSKGLF